MLTYERYQALRAINIRVPGEPGNEANRNGGSQQLQCSRSGAWEPGNEARGLRCTQIRILKNLEPATSSGIAFRTILEGRSVNCLHVCGFE